MEYLDDPESSQEFKSNAAQSDYAEQEESVMESSGDSDFSFTGDDLDTTMQIEECAVLEHLLKNFH